ncbi:uncharacterized protein LOC112564211 [Pomacea canaliculata]|uniref:uncharacterized protein LOC112564211 n=1 Tax=Pomacea canaliculata TaxID=400727 RepID=UPI000D739DD3|nr:uncharacterized protein LOC112564211 [Pomacea canaliculata]XP_025094657.1 uncharacterized protein LOC112564211 [Pomacea canaliculata]
MASTNSFSNQQNVVNVERPVAKLLLNSSVMVDFFGELIDACLSIDRSSIASGRILVTHGDPKKVVDVINEVVVKMDVLAMENDEEVLKVLNSLKTKFTGQFETDFDQNSSTFKSVVHRKVKNEIEPEIISLTTKTGRFLVSRQHMSYLQCHLDHIQEEVHTSWPDSAVSITLQKEVRGEGSMLVSSKRFDFESVKKFIENFTTNIQKFSKDLEPSRALLLSGPRGQKEVRQLEREHNCRVSVLLPGHQVLVRAEHPGGHGLFLCEGNMAATDCDVLVLPFNETFRNWTPTQKLILQQGLLTTRTDMYAKFIGCSPKPCTLALKCPRPDDGRTVVLIHVPSSPEAEEMDKGLAEALRLSCARGAFVALPVAMSTSQSLEENLKRIVCVVQEHFNEEEKATTIVLYLEKSSAGVRQKLIEGLEKMMTTRWKTETDLAAVYEENCTSSPTLVIVGQTRDVETTHSKLQTMHVPSDLQERVSLLDTGKESGSDLCTVSNSVNSDSGAANKAKNNRSTGLYDRKDDLQEYSLSSSVSARKAPKARRAKKLMPDKVLCGQPSLSSIPPSQPLGVKTQSLRLPTVNNQTLLSSNIVSKTRLPCQEEKERENKEKEDGEADKTVCVTGLTAGDEEVCQLYFENTKLSGGGDIAQQGCVWDDMANQFLITFVDRQAAYRVLERSHTIANRHLRVKQYIPPPCYKDTVLVTGIPRGTSADCLQNFLESVADMALDIVQMNNAEGKAIVSLADEEADLKHVKHLQQACLKNPLYGHSVLSVQRIPLCHTVLVDNLNPKTKESAILYFFSNKNRNSGGPVTHIKRLNSTSALVHFENYKDAQAVVDKGSHILDEFPLKVSLHLECFQLTAEVTE